MAKVISEPKNNVSQY